MKEKNLVRKAEDAINGMLMDFLVPVLSHISMTLLWGHLFMVMGISGPW
jgi:hypothetical protein